MARICEASRELMGIAARLSLGSPCPSKFAPALPALAQPGAAPPHNPAAALCLRAVFKKYMGARFLEVGALTLPALAE